MQDPPIRPRPVPESRQYRERETPGGGTTFTPIASPPNNNQSSERLVNSPSASSDDIPSLILPASHYNQPVLNSTPLGLLRELEDDLSYRINDLNQVIAHNRASMARAEAQLARIRQFITIQNNMYRRRSGRTSPLSQVTTPPPPVQPVFVSPPRVPRNRRDSVIVARAQNQRTPNRRYDNNGRRLREQTFKPLKF